MTTLPFAVFSRCQHQAGEWADWLAALLNEPVEVEFFATLRTHSDNAIDAAEFALQLRSSNEHWQLVFAGGSGIGHALSEARGDTESRGAPTFVNWVAEQLFNVAQEFEWQVTAIRSLAECGVAIETQPPEPMADVFETPIFGCLVTSSQRSWKIWFCRSPGVEGRMSNGSGTVHEVVPHEIEPRQVHQEACSVAHAGEIYQAQMRLPIDPHEPLQVGQWIPLTSIDMTQLELVAKTNHTTSASTIATGELVQAGLLRGFRWKTKSSPP